VENASQALDNVEPRLVAEAPQAQGVDPPSPTVTTAKCQIAP
jgi:hypothetical protein